MNGFLVFVHILGAAIWAGGLVFVGLTAAVARRTVPPQARIEFFRVLGTGFLVLAGIAAAMLLISGNVLVEDLFGGWDALGDSSAGRLVLWKTALYGLVLVLAIVHAFVLGPRIRRLRESELAANAGDSATALRRATALSAVAQVLMLAGTIAILALAADLIS